MKKIQLDKTPLETWIAQKIGVDASECLTSAQLNQYQLRKLNETIQVAASHSPFYRTRLEGVADKVLHSFEDFRQIPFTTADDIKEQGNKMVCVSQSEISRVVTLQSSGTTGQSKRIFFTPADQELTIDFFQQAMSTFVAAGDKTMILLPCKPVGSVGDLLAMALQRLGVQAIAYGVVHNPLEALDIIEREQVTSLVGIPVQVLALARYSSGRERCLVRNVLLSTDYVSAAITCEIQRNWECKVFEHYGMTEMGLGGGIECQARAGYHLREADLYFEVIDPQSGEPLAVGEEGEVVFTTLTRQGMPLIRYRTGDISRFIVEPCDCGAFLRRLAPVAARLEGKVCIVEHDYLTMGDLDEALFPIEGVINFTATVIYHRMHIVLKLDAVVLALQGITDLIIERLRTITVLTKAERAGKLIMKVEAISGGPDITPQAAKRTIKVVGQFL